MKTQAKFLAIVLLIASSMTAFAVNPPDSKKNIQVLPAQAGTLKVLYFNPTEKNVTIRMYNDNGLLFKDVVKVNKEEQGFIKRYDVSQIECQEFWVEIGDKDQASKFRIKKDAKGNLWATYWDDYQQTGSVLAAN